MVLSELIWNEPTWISITPPLLSICVYNFVYICIYPESKPELQLGSTQYFSYLEPHMQLFDIRKPATFWLKWLGWYIEVLQQRQEQTVLLNFLMPVSATSLKKEVFHALTFQLWWMLYQSPLQALKKPEGVWWQRVKDRGSMTECSVEDKDSALTLYIGQCVTSLTPFSGILTAVALVYVKAKEMHFENSRHTGGRSSNYWMTVLTL